MPAECSICAEEEVCVERCPGCKFQACEPCWKQYLLTTKETSCKCMKCSRALDRCELVDLVGIPFVKQELEKVWMDNAFEMQVSMMPATQPLVTEKLLKEKKEKLEMKLVEVHHRMMYTGHSTETQERLSRRSAVLRAALKLNRAKIGRNSAVHTYMCHCPEPNCKGYVRESDNSCGMCGTVVCSSCEVKQDEGHVCDQETVASVQAHRTQTRRCPRCPLRVQRIDGCPSMFCMSCHCHFDYNTGAELTDRRDHHNPHYFEWRESRNKKYLADDGTDILDTEWLTVAIDIQGRATEDDKILLQALQFAHKARTSNPTWVKQDLSRKEEDKLQAARIDYLLNRKTMKEFKSMLKKTRKTNEINIERTKVISETLDELCHHLNDVLVRKCADRKPRITKIHNALKDGTRKMEILREAFDSNSKNFLAPFPR